MREAPDFLIHSGDISHLSKPVEFDTADQVLKGARLPRVFYVPGEHDVLTMTGSSIASGMPEDQGEWVVQLRPQGMPLRRPRQRDELKAGGMVAGQ